MANIKNQEIIFLNIRRVNNMEEIKLTEEMELELRNGKGDEADE